MTKEFNRFLRHLSPVLVAYAMSKGWVPEGVPFADLVEVVSIVLVTTGSLTWSKLREKRLVQ